MIFIRKDQLNMTEGPFLKKLVVFALPVLLTGFLQLLYNAADLIVVGQFATSDAQGAIQSTGALINLIVNVSLGLAVGVNVAVAKYIGAQDENAVSKVVHTGLILSLIIGVFIAAFGFFQAHYFLELMNSAPELVELSTLYLKIFFLGTPLNLFYNFGAAALRAKGETQKPLFYLFVSGAINVALNLFFVLVLDMDVDGVAIATITSQGISAVLVFIELKKTRGYCRIYVKKLKIDGGALKEILQIGLPAGVQGSMFSISNVLIQSTINTFGKVVVTANGNATSLEGFMYIAVDCVYQAALAFIGQNYGANRKENIKKVMRETFFMVTLLCAVLAAVMIPLRRVFLSVYNTDPEIISNGELRMLINVTTYFLFGWMQIFVAYLRGMGHGVLPVIVSVLGVCVFRIVWIYTVFPLWPTLISIYLSYPISWAITALAHFICHKLTEKKSYERMNAEALARVYS